MLRHSWIPRTVFNKMWCSFNAYWCPRGALCVVVEKRDPPTPHSSCPILMVKETPTLSTQRHRSPHPFHQNCPGDWGRRASCRFERETEFLHFHSSCSIPMVKGAPDEREKQNPFILHSSYIIPVIKETTYHPHRDSGVLIKSTPPSISPKTVWRAGVVALVGTREALHFIGFLSNAATFLGPPGSFE